MSSRSHLTMTPSEIAQMLDRPLTMTISTLNRDGSIHAVPVYYGFVGDAVAFHTKARSQKVRNLERNSTITCSVCEGTDPNELRGVTIIAVAELFDDETSLRELNLSTIVRYAPDEQMDADAVFATKVRKRVGVRVRPQRIISFDHAKFYTSGA